jgi:DNA-binding transcriptional regulator WhiA
MSKDIKPFEELSETDQKTAIDIAVAASLIVTRLPAISELVFDAISREFAAFYDLRANIAKYSLRSLGRTLFETQWECTITKDAQHNLITEFRQGDAIPGDNGTTP